MNKTGALRVVQTPSRSTDPWRRQCVSCGTHTVGGATCGTCRAADGGSRAAMRAPRKGVTQCTGGKLVASVANEHAVGNCVQVHEDAHVSDPRGAEACKRVKLCVDRDDGGNLCSNAYSNWVDPDSANAAALELRAYTAEAVCLRDTIDMRCGAAKSRHATIGGAVGAGVLGAGGGVGGAALGAKLAPQVSAKSGIGGLVGGIVGAGAGAGLGWLVGHLAGGLAAGSQASEEDCKQVQGELEECDIAIKEFGQRAQPAPLPFEPDGRLIKSLIPKFPQPQSGVDSTQPGTTGQQDSQPLAPIQARAAGGLAGLARESTPRGVPELIENALRSPSGRLDPATRGFMEPAFQHDFRGVKIHADGHAARSARAVDAHAYTVGDHIVFDAGRYAPSARDGRTLLAHELAHVVQNARAGGAGPAAEGAVSRPSDAAEREAAGTADRVVDGEAMVGVSQRPQAALQRASGAGLKTAGIVGGVILGVGLVGAGIAWALGAFDSKKAKKTADGEAKAPDSEEEAAPPKLTFEEALKVGAEVLKPEFGLTEGGRLGLDPGDGYDASEWKEGESTPAGDQLGGVVITPTIASSWTAMSHMFKNIGKAVPKAGGGTTKWSFDCFEYVEVLRLYALWRSMDRADFDKAFSHLEIGFWAPRINQEWGKAFRADGPHQKPYQFQESAPVVSGGSMNFATTTKVTVKKTWPQILDEAPIGSQVIWSNVDAAKQCAANSTLEFCAYSNENTTKLGPGSYSAHPFGVVTVDFVMTGIATPVLEHAARNTAKFRQTPEAERVSYVADYVKTHLKAYIDKNIYISAIRYPKNPSGPAESKP